MADPSGSNNCKPRTGGGPDSATRPFIDRLSRLFGQQFIVENRGGASGSLGFKAVVKSPAGGYTFLATPSLSVVIVPHLRKVPFDPLKDLVPVTHERRPDFPNLPLLKEIYPAMDIRVWFGIFAPPGRGMSYAMNKVTDEPVLHQTLFAIAMAPNPARHRP